MAWSDTVRSKREAQARALAIAEGEEFQSLDLSVTKIDNVPDLLERISTGQVTSEAVTKAYIRSLTEVLFEDAIAQARELDAHYREHGRLRGPLHGVPVTLKDQFNVAGYDSTLGYVGRAFKPAREDAVLTGMLKKLGAVVVAKTNLPQSIMWCETENPLWGLTTHPCSKRYTPGGSSGGEGALLALEASIVGFGTDIGGSVRIPAHMQGLYALKPSSSRLPYYGAPVSTEGQEHVPSSVGPLARSLSTLDFIMRELIHSEPWEHDARCAPKAWDQETLDAFKTKPLTIGILVDDGVVRPHPPVTRVLLDLVQKLKGAGHEVIDWDPRFHAECIQVLDEYYTADGGEDIRRDMSVAGEPYVPHVEAIVNRGRAISVYEYWQLNRRKIELQQAYLRKWNSIRSPATGRPVDVVLMPTMPHAAVPHRACRWVGYTKVWNVLDYAALVLPAGRVGPVDGGAAWDHAARNALDEANLATWAQNKSDMIEMELPVSVQIVGRKLEEEKILGVGHAINSLI
ncbi:amidase [Xylariaceae sp. FL0804]|nr:amidase [Xylariaceae sp. FL0804]